MHVSTSKYIALYVNLFVKCLIYMDLARTTSLSFFHNFELHNQVVYRSISHRWLKLVLKASKRPCI